MASTARFDWEKNTKCFSADGSKPARLKLRQVDDDKFELRTPFLFTHPKTGVRIPVAAELLGRTDLASVPTFLGWFARRHGRHTFAALMHDELVTPPPDALPSLPPMSRREADLLFRDALVDSEVPLVKAWIMWSGVTLGTRWSMRPWGAAGIAAWFLAAVSGTVALFYGLVTGSLPIVVVAALAPVPFALLWGRQQYPAGITAGYAFWFVAAGALPAWLAYQIYRGIEWAVIPLRQLRPRNRKAQLPPPAPYRER